MNANDNNTTNDRTNSKYMWVVYFVGYEDSSDNEDSRVEPLVGCERVETTDDAEQMTQDAELTALLRGGRVVAMLGDDAEQAEYARVALEKEIMRYR